MDLDKLKAKWAKPRDPRPVILWLIREVESLRAELAETERELRDARSLLPLRTCVKCGQRRTADQVAEIGPNRWRCNYGACPPPERA